MALTPEDVAARVERVSAERASLGLDGPFDISMLARSDRLTPEEVAAFADVGLTWWLESLSLRRGSLDELSRLVAAGPPMARPGGQEGQSGAIG